MIGAIDRSRGAGLKRSHRRPPRRRPRQKDDPRHDPDKLDYVAHLPCLVGKTDPEGCSGRITVHHVRRFGGKRDDRRAIPLCEGHHQKGPRAYHVLGGREPFERIHQVDLWASSVELHERYLLERAA